MASCKDPEAFLAKADEVERLVKGIIANDESAIKDADAFIAKQEGTPPGNASIGVDRTVISSSKSKPQDQAVPPELRAMERDIEERHQRRLEREARANEKKAAGNAMFAAGDFEAAVRAYTDAIAINPAGVALYTNRAQAHLKLKHFRLARDNCDTAIRIDENNVKAHLRRGLACQALGLHEEALASFTTARKVGTAKDRPLVDKYIKEAERQQTVAAKEIEAVKAAHSGVDPDLAHLEIAINDMLGSDSPKTAAALSAAQALLTSVIRQDLFRAKGGLRVLEVVGPQAEANHEQGDSKSDQHQAEPDSKSGKQQQLVAAALDTLAVACKGNDASARAFFALPETLGLTLESAAHDTLMPNAVALLTTCCTESASLTAIDATVAHRLCDAAVAMLCKPNQSSENTTGALDWLAALLQDDRARRHVTKCAADLFGRVVAHLDATFAAQDMAGLSSATSVLVMGCNHSALRNHVAKHCLPSIMATTLAAAQILKGAKAGSPAQVFAQGASVACLTAAYNATGDSASALQTPEWLAMLAQHLGTTTTSPVAPMVLNVLSRICKTEDGVAYAAKELPQLVETIIHHAAVTDLSVQKPAARLLAQLARASVACRRRIAAPAQRSVLLDLLKHPDTSVTGNAALCLADCCHDSAVCADLVGTDIVATLLDYAKQDKSALQGNSAIALARLAQGHKAHLLRLKELRGIEILQSRMPKP
eukprot:m.207695 g.207695  ORF g.207695 m.207695 type:complete len:711 (+) comp18523_c0_seq15:72-2204(+)